VNKKLQAYCTNIIYGKRMNVFLVPGSPENIERSIIDGVELNEMDISDQA